MVKVSFISINERNVTSFPRATFSVLISSGTFSPRCSLISAKAAVPPSVPTPNNTAKPAEANDLKKAFIIFLPISIYFLIKTILSTTISLAIHTSKVNVVQASVGTKLKEI